MFLNLLMIFVCNVSKFQGCSVGGHEGVGSVSATGPTSQSQPILWLVIFDLFVTASHYYNYNFYFVNYVFDKLEHDSLILM